MEEKYPTVLGVKISSNKPIPMLIHASAATDAGPCGSPAAFRAKGIAATTGSCVSPGGGAGVCDNFGSFDMSMKTLRVDVN